MEYIAIKLLTAQKYMMYLIVIRLLESDFSPRRVKNNILALSAVLWGISHLHWHYTLHLHKPISLDAHCILFWDEEIVSMNPPTFDKIS